MRASLDPRLEGLTERVIGAAFAVSRELGHGFLEAVYRNALTEEFSAAGIPCEMEKQFAVWYRGKVVGRYIADLVVGSLIVVELKAISALSESHMVQAFNYLRVSGLPAALLINFGTPKVQLRRILNERALSSV